MYKIIHRGVLIIILLSFASSNVLAENICYEADKNDFNQTLFTPHHIIFDLSDLKKNNLIDLSFVSSLPIPYANRSYDFYCMQEEKKRESYECVGDDDGGRMHIRIEDYDLYVNVEYARMANTTDDPVINHIRSKQNKFTRAERTVCPKPHIFKNKQENHLPYVCYNWKGEEVIKGKSKAVYHGCARHNKACKSTEAQHFGKYKNDYEAHKAFQRCENSTPRSDTYTQSSPSTETLEKFIKSKSKSKSKKKELLDAITIKDVSIYDLDYYNDLVIAVGEDDSVATDKLQSMDEYHESVMLRSTDGGKSWTKIREGSESSVPHDTVIVLDNKRIAVASSIEGAGGSIILSSDAGDSWETRYDGAMIDSMKQIKGDTLIAKTWGPTLKSIDGGKNWVEVPSK